MTDRLPKRLRRRAAAERAAQPPVHVTRDGACESYCPGCAVDDPAWWRAARMDFYDPEGPISHVERPRP